MLDLLKKEQSYLYGWSQESNEKKGETKPMPWSEATLVWLVSNVKDFGFYSGSEEKS